ncbi:MAG TPA: hypothetical protein VHL59_08470 [Thermoanaerobaculia bacterium]|nr:hypothetical protein [Thermoanaerobaculia bacterium]
MTGATTGATGFSTTGDLTAAAVIGQIESGAYPREVVSTIARGFLPLEQDELIAVLGYLCATDDAEIASLARTSLGELPQRAVLDFAMNEQAAPEHLARLMGAGVEGIVLEALIRNRAVPDETIAELARRADPRVQEVIVINQARILRAPAILDALLENPALSPEARRRAMETREEFFEKKARVQPLEEEREEEEVIDLPLDPIRDLLERAAEADKEQPPAPTLTLMESEKNDPNKFALWARLYYMSVSEKVQLAFKGDRLMRMLLVRDRNKLICSAVMRNPRITETEIENIAGMRNVDDEVLRIIGTRRDWSGRYNVMVTLCRNPKTPVGVVLPFINRLTLRDLKGLKDDKGVPAVVRESAKKLYLSRTQKTG